jgi:AraC-like DNA-binding protein
MHLVLALDGELSIRVGDEVLRGAGVLTAPDVPHALDARGVDVLLVFVDPESAVGASLASALDRPVRIVTDAERRALDPATDPMAIMGADGPAWTAKVAAALGRDAPKAKRVLHPRVRRLLARLRAEDLADTSLEALAREARLSPSRLMHVFTESIGIPLRPYLVWLRLQRAAFAIVSGRTLTDAAAFAGFADAAHMSRSFRRAFGMAPSALRPGQPVRSSVAPARAVRSAHGKRT